MSQATINGIRTAVNAAYVSVLKRHITHGESREVTRPARDFKDYEWMNDRVKAVIVAEIHGFDLENEELWSAIRARLLAVGYYVETINNGLVAVYERDDEPAIGKRHGPSRYGTKTQVRNTLTDFLAFLENNGFRIRDELHDAHDTSLIGDFIMDRSPGVWTEG